MDYSLCVTADGKNYATIEKIIAELAMNDFERANPRRKDGKFKHGHYVPYSLSMETLDAVETKHDYLSGKISEETYKAYCLRYNLTHLHIDR